MFNKYLITALLAIASGAAFAQTENDDAAKRAMITGHTIQQERVYLHFDNNSYYLGETMWFKAYVSYGTNDRTTTPSRVLYVELVAPEGYVVETKKYKIDEDGCCNGEFELTPLLLSGYYEVRAYTRYMLNWGKDAIFSRVFPIFDKVNGNNWDFKNMLDRKRGFERNGEWISHELPDADLKFYPEGGNLVAGLPSTTAYELRGCDGEPVKSTITIYEEGDPLLTTTPEHIGKGKFTFTPKSKTKYRAEVKVKNEKGNEKTHKFDLPEIASEGVTIAMSQTGDSISFTLRNNLTEPQETAFAILYRGAIGYYKKINAAEKEKTLTLSLNELPEGVNKAIIFKGRHPLAERCFFVTHNDIQKSDRSTVKLNIKSDNLDVSEISLGAHEKIVLDIKREDNLPIPATADLSISVSDAAGKLTTSWSYNMYSYLLLGSELKGYIPDAAQYFDPENNERKSQLDLLMLTNGWTAYDWEQLTKEQQEDLQPIERGITIRGNFFRKNIGTLKLGKEREVTLIPQKNNLTRFDIAYDKDIISYTFRTDSTGAFLIETKDFYGKRIAAINPQTALRQNNNIRYCFALDRYFSPAFRLYDYWERNTGTPMNDDEKRALDSLIQINPFNYMLSSVEVVSDAKKEYKPRPPHSEMRLNFLDEWEYAQDITYLKEFHYPEDGIDFKYSDEDSMTNDELITYSLTKQAYIYPVELDSMVKYFGHVPNYNFTTEPQSETYRHSMSAADILTSAMYRHNYNWADWVMFMVVLGEYDSNKVPTPDNEYLLGKGDAEKMMNFKEIIIRSDEETRKQFENSLTDWDFKAHKFATLHPVQKFYTGFFTQFYLTGTEGVDNFASLTENFKRTLIDHFDPKHPNYVACFIPYTEEEKNSRTGIIPDLANSTGVTRYTSVQGYNESKKFYSPDYSRATPTEKNDYRRTLLWNPAPQITPDGTIRLELHNSSYCNEINIDITGRDEQTYYSNDAVTVTKINQYKKEEPAQKTVESTEEEGTPEPMDPAVEQACKRQYNRAMAFYNQKRYRNAIPLLAELAKYDYIPALNKIAQCYLDGTGVAKNMEQAARFYEMAAKAGDAHSQYEISVMYKNGIGFTADAALAKTWLHRASKNKEPRAMAEVAKEHIAAGGEGDFAAANALMTEVARSQTAAGLYEYALFIEQYPDAQKATASDTPVGCMKTAADKGHAEAQIYTMEHEYATQNYAEAYRWARTLSLAGRHEGTKRMADCYYNGQGIKQDKKLAKDLYRTAANAGNKEAAEILKNL